MSPADTILAACFWCSATGVVFTYLGYPALIFALSRLFGKDPIPREGFEADADLPHTALLIAAHNEALVVEDRLRNALALDYPRDRFEIVVASDGSDDGTADLCAAFGPPVRTLAFAERQGKSATLNRAMAQLSAEIVVLPDANPSMAPEAPRRLARWFAAPAIGVVCGRLILTDPRTSRNADGLYWRYETFLKRCEARLNGLLGANGAIYAIRRNLFSPLPQGAMVDDFVITLDARRRTGCRIVYDEQAIASEEAAPDLRAEFRRRARIGIGGAQAIATLWPLLSPCYGWTAFTFFSHKVMRWACPFLMACALVSAAALARIPLYRSSFLAQACFYAACLVPALLPARTRLPRLLNLPPMFAAMNLALLVGFARAALSRQTGVWTRTARPSPGRAAPNS